MEWDGSKESKKILELHSMTLSTLYHFALQHPPQGDAWREDMRPRADADTPFTAYVERCLNSKRPQKALR
jgi:hypothetical protein